MNEYENCLRHTKKSEKNSIHKKGIGEILDESIAFFEAYLNALYSFLQIIGRLTPYFYDKKGLKKPIPVKFFALQINYFRDNPDVDPEYSNYLKNNMTWHDELSHNRHAVSHNVSAFLGFGEEEIEFIDMPKKRIDFFKNGKPTKKLEEYILDNRDSLFKFLKFYVEPFSNRQIFVDREEELKEVSKRIRAPTGQTRARS